MAQRSDVKGGKSTAVSAPPNPLLRWAGSKKRQFRTFRAKFPLNIKRYAEPFAGSASFLFCLKAEGGFINDINADVIGFYQSVSEDPEKLYDNFVTIPRNGATYYDMRTLFHTLPLGHQRSTLFYYLNRNCFNGIYRVNKLGCFNVPFSDRRVSPYPTRAEFIRSAELVGKCAISNLDFEEFCQKCVSKDCFVFLDPPYYEEGARVFNEYNRLPFGPEDMSRLKSVLHLMDGRGAKFLLSFPSSPTAIDIARRWNSEETNVFRSVAGNPSLRRRHSELLIANYEW